MSCPVRLAFRDGAPESLYEPSPMLSFLADSLPRFGQAHDLQQDWMQKEDSSGYAVGVFTTSIVISCVLVVWGVLLVMCYRAGYARVGIFSGSLPPRQAPPKPPRMLSPLHHAETAKSLVSSVVEMDSSTRSSQTAKRTNCLAESHLQDQHSRNISDSSLPSISTLPSMFYDDDDDSGTSDQTPPQDPGPPLPKSPLPDSLIPSKGRAVDTAVVLSATSPSAAAAAVEGSTLTTPEPDKNNGSDLQEQTQAITTPMSVEISALTTPDHPVSSTKSFSSTSSSKYQEYLKYLEEAAGGTPKRLITYSNGNNTSISHTSMDSVDLLLDEVLADADQVAGKNVKADGGDDNSEPTFWTSDLPEPSLVYPDAPPSPIAKQLDLSFPQVGAQEGFLFDDSSSSAAFNDDDDEDQENQPPSVPLPRSSFISPAASRKRLLENFVHEFKKQTSQFLLSSTNPLPTSNDSTLLFDDHGMEDLEDGDFDKIIAPTLPEMDTKSTEEDDDDEDSAMSSSSSTTANDGPPPPPQQFSPSLHITTADIHNFETGEGEEDDFDTFVKKQAAWIHERRTFQQQVHRARGGVVAACTLLVVGTLLGALQGAWALAWQQQRMLLAWDDLLQKTVLKLQEFVQEYRELQHSVEEQMWNFWQLLDQHCPLISTSVCPLAYSANATCDLQGIPLQNSWQDWLDVYQSPQHVAESLFGNQDWNAVAWDIEQFLDQPVQQSLQGWNWALWAAVACNGLLGIYALTILVAISLPDATRLHYQLSTTRFAIVYWTTVLLAWVFGMCYWVGTTVTVDACQEPAEITKTLLGRMDTHSFLPDYWGYIVDGCPSDSYPEAVQDQVWMWANFLPVTDRIASDLQIYSENAFAATCGSPLLPLRNAANALQLQLCMTTESLVNVRRVLGCDQWYPWYESMANAAVCQQGSVAFVWSSAAQMFVLIMAFLIWTLRVSFLSLVREDDEAEACEASTNTRGTKEGDGSSIT